MSSSMVPPKSAHCISVPHKLAPVKSESLKSALFKSNPLRSAFLKSIRLSCANSKDSASTTVSTFPDMSLISIIAVFASLMQRYNLFPN